MASIGNPRHRPKGKIILGRYEQGRLLGKGAFAKVYEARCISSGESVAIKILDKKKVLKAGRTAHIEREVSVLRRVRHPHVVHLLEVMATKAKIFLVMELVRGGELFDRVAKGRLPEGVARRYFQQLVSAVAFCHDRGVFHRDLKPENLLLDEDGNLKVTDFGLSAVADQTDDGLFHTRCGTLAYVAPEVLARKRYDAAMYDVWSVGVILFVLMAGYLPFNECNVAFMCRKIYKGEFRCPRWFSLDLIQLLHRLLDPKPETRITIPEIMEEPWFKKDFKRVRFYLLDDKIYSADDMSSPPWSPLDDRFAIGAGSPSSRSPPLKKSPLGLPRPASLNAFDIISSSPGFNLSGLFEEKGEEVIRFISAKPVPEIISKLEEIANVLSFAVRKKGCRLRLEGSMEGVKGSLLIAAEIFELTPPLVVVEVKKKTGDKAEYEKFCSQDLIPGMQSIAHPAASMNRIRSPTTPANHEQPPAKEPHACNNPT